MRPGAKQQARLVGGIRGIQAKLDNEVFLAKAPPDVVARERQRLDSLRGELDAVEKLLTSLN